MPKGISEKMKKRKEEIIGFLKKEPRFNFEIMYAFNLSTSQLKYTMNQLIREGIVCKRKYVGRGGGTMYVYFICGDMRFSRLECLGLDVIEKYFSRSSGVRMAISSRASYLSTLVDNIILPYILEKVKVWKSQGAKSFGVAFIFSMVKKHFNNAILYASKTESGHVIIIDVKKLREKLKTMKKRCEKERKI